MKFWRWRVSLVKFSYGSNFDVNIITGSGVMTILIYTGLTRNLEIGNAPVWVLSNIWRLEWVRTTKFFMNVSNKELLNTAKCQGYSFYCFWVIKGKPTGEGKGKETPYCFKVFSGRRERVHWEEIGEGFVTIFSQYFQYDW